MVAVAVQKINEVLALIDLDHESTCVDVVADEGQRTIPQQFRQMGMLRDLGDMR